MKCSILAPCVNYYENAFDATGLIDLIVKESEAEWPRLPWERSSVGPSNKDVSISERRSSMTMSLQPIMTDSYLVPELDSIREEFFSCWKKIDELIWDYRNTYDLYLGGHEVVSILRYSDGAEYHLHTDSSPENGRQMSMVAYLNDDYSGGDLEFPHFNLKIKPTAGSVIFFPSNYAYAHIAHPVKNGVKYSLVTWFQ